MSKEVTKIILEEDKEEIKSQILKWMTPKFNKFALIKIRRPAQIETVKINLINNFKGRDKTITLFITK